MLSERPARSTLEPADGGTRKSTGTGGVQVLLIDKTTLNVGPKSTLVIDRFGRCENDRFDAAHPDPPAQLARQIIKLRIQEKRWARATTHDQSP
jgi:hypothetical protein